MNTKPISQTVPTDSKRLLSITEATVYLGVGRNSARCRIYEITA